MPNKFGMHHVEAIALDDLRAVRQLNNFFDHFFA
jgi:hypothetical protein